MIGAAVGATSDADRRLGETRAAALVLRLELVVVTATAAENERPASTFRRVVIPARVVGAARTGCLRLLTQI